MRPRAAVAALVACAGLVLARDLEAQRRRVIVVDTSEAGRAARAAAAARPDTVRDTSAAGRTLPRRPSRTFPSPDSIIQALSAREGFRITRYRADSMRLLAREKEIRLSGRVLVEREGASLEADTARYVEGRCAVFAVGSPRLFDPSGVLVGEEMTYDACNRTGIIGRARTDFAEGSATWFLYGNLAFDNAENRTFAADASITSCELEDPHYHFAARDVKYVTKRLMVSRPAVLYVQDVPVLWLPFIFQDMRRGRRSGFIPPQFGLNDIVRNSRSYQRHVANLGYYWAFNDYTDAQVTLDWYAQRFVAVRGLFRYSWLERFLDGDIALLQMYESGGSTSRRLSWRHRQSFNRRTSLTANLDYASSSRVVSRNSVDPILAVATIDSRLNFQRQFDWGQLNVGGSRTQSLDKPQVSTTFPTMSFTPTPIALSSSVTWSPSFSLTNSLQHRVGPGAAVFLGPGVADTQLVDSRQTTVGIQSPVRIGRWTLANSFAITDSWTNRREVQTIVDPVDSTVTVRTYGEDYQTGVDWQTGFGLPILLQGTWNLQPSVQFVNTTGGPFLLRNRYSGGAFVSQGKRVQFAASVAPTFFGLFGGVGPIARLRHAFSPVISWAYAPAAEVPEAYARAANRGVLPTTLRSDPRQTITIGLSQSLEAKLRPARAPGDSAAETPAVEGRKIKLLSIQSDPLTFDLEQGRRRGRTAWTNDQWGNTLSSDLLRGFSLRLTHDLFDGPVGVVGSRFRPALSSVAMGFSVGESTLRSIGGLLGLRVAPPEPTRREPDQAAGDTLRERAEQERRRDFTSAFQRGAAATGFSRQPGPGAGFQASLSYSLQRTYPDSVAGQARPLPTENQVIRGAMSFAPTRHWHASWETSYNVTRGEFSDHVVRLERDLHDWRATFTFVKSPNGNFLFGFSIQLIDQPDLHFDYDQRNIFR
jgi:hypothetical protein